MLEQRYIYIVEGRERDREIYGKRHRGEHKKEYTDIAEI